VSSPNGLGALRMAMVERLEAREKEGWADRTVTSVSSTGLSVEASAEEDANSSVHFISRCAS
jgi:hypothetical protein